MARSFDGANDEIDFGSDASIDGFTSQTISMWVRHTAAATDILIAKGQSVNAWMLAISGTNTLRWDRDFDGATNGQWTGQTVFSINEWHHIVMTYDGSSATNDPVFYQNGAVKGTVETITPAGSIVSDATPNLRIGEDSGNALDYAGEIGCLSYDNKIWTQAQVNRAMWYGAPFGPSSLKTYFPFHTTGLNNEGTAVATGTAIGSTVISMPKVERCMANMLGCGR